MLSNHPNPNQNYTKIQNFESGLMAQIENSRPWKFILCIKLLNLLCEVTLRLCNEVV